MTSLKETRLNDHTQEIVRDSNLQELNPLGRVPNVGLKEFRKNNSKINRYLWYQTARIEKHLKEKNYDAIVLIFLMLLKNSISYQILLFHKTKSYWYWKKPEEVVIKDFTKTVNKLRSFDLTLYLKRFYVIKNKLDSNRQGMKFDPESNPLLPGEKLRPIGSPELPSAVISKAFTNIIGYMFEDDRGGHKLNYMASQHGYRPNKGVYSAILGVIKEYLEDPSVHVMEYDFKSYFNKVAINWVRYKLEEKSSMLANLVGSMLLKVEYIFDDIEKENELTVYGVKQIKNKLYPLILRSGLPQGLSMSPLLSTLAQEFAPVHPGNKAYADDGLFLSKDPEEFYYYMESLGGYGVSIEDSKTKSVDKTKEIKFCGVYINFSQEYVRYERSKCGFKESRLEEWLKQVASHYGKQPYRWEWDIEPSAMINKFRISWRDIPLYDLVLTYIKGLWDWSQHKGKMYIIGKGFYDITHSSTYCINELIEISKGLEFKKKKAIKIPVFTEQETVEVKKQNYLETFYDVNVFEGTNNFSEHIEMVNLLKRKMELEES